MLGFNLHKAKRHFTELLAERFPDREAEQLMRILLEDLLGIDRKRLLMEPNLRIDEEQYALLKVSVRKLLEGMPVQYVTGTAFFGPILLKVGPTVLIPRPETEELVQRIAKSLPADRPLRIWDIGTGSGCIAIALAKLFPLAEVRAFDRSSEALDVARQNALANGVKVDFTCEDVLCPTSETFAHPVDVVVSNPPYIRLSEQADMEPIVLEHEPSLALFVPDNDPLVFYRQILKLATPWLSDQGVVWFEINEAMGEEMLQLCHANGFQATLLHDFAEKPRFIQAKKIIKKLF